MEHGPGGGRLFKPEAQEAQRQRFADTPLSCNAGLGRTEVRKICRLDETGRGLVRVAMLAGASRPAPAWLQMSTRAFHRILKLARTIADLAGSERIETAHPSTLAQDKPAGGDSVSATAGGVERTI